MKWTSSKKYQDNFLDGKYIRTYVSMISAAYGTNLIVLDYVPS